MIPKKFLKDFIFTIFLFCFFSACAKDVIKVKEESYINKAIGYIELNCYDYFFYGDLLITGQDNLIKVSIYNFGNEILKIELVNENIKVYYLGTEINQDYFQIIPVDVRFLMSLLKKFFLQQNIEEDSNIFFERDNDKKILNITVNNCKVRLFLTKDI